jgi:hypothetical protein
VGIAPIILKLGFTLLQMFSFNPYTIYSGGKSPSPHTSNMKLGGLYSQSGQYGVGTKLLSLRKIET